MLLPVIRIENSVHVIVRMACEHVNVLVRLVPRAQQIGINTPPAFGPRRRFVHAVSGGNAFRKRLVHSSHNRLNGRIGQVLGQVCAQTRQLSVVKLLGRGIVQEVERDAAIDPMEVSFHAVIVGIVLQALGAQDGRIEPIRKLQQEIFAGFRAEWFRDSRCPGKTEWSRMA